MEFLHSNTTRHDTQAVPAVVKTGTAIPTGVTTVEVSVAPTIVSSTAATTTKDNVIVGAGTTTANTKLVTVATTSSASGLAVPFFFSYF